MSNKENKKGTGKRVALIILIVFLALVLLVLVGGTVFITGTLNKLSRPEQNETLSPSEIEALLDDNQYVDDLYGDGSDDVDVTEVVEETDPDVVIETIDPEDVTLPETPVEQIVSEENQDNYLNILLVGQDSRDPAKRARSDSMILCTLDKSTGTLTMTSFMRDMYVKIPGYYNQRMNVAYMVGGFDALYDTLEYNFGINVDKGVAVNFQSFAKLINLVGGVEVELTDAEVRYMKGKNPDWKLSAGVNKLTGAAALTYARARKIGGGGDFDRSQRQRNVITALLVKMKDMSLIDLYNLVDEVLPMVYTDMSNAEIVSMAMELAPLLKDLKVVSQRIPIDGGYRMTMVNEMSVLLPDLQKNRKFLVETIGDM